MEEEIDMFGKKKLPAFIEREEASCFGLSDFQLLALNLITKKSCELRQWYLLVVIDIVFDRHYAEWGHQVKISFLNSDGRLWLNKNSFTVEDTESVRTNREVSDYGSQHEMLEDLLQKFPKIINATE